MWVKVNGQLRLQSGYVQDETDLLVMQTHETKNEYVVSVYGSINTTCPVELLTHRDILDWVLCALAREDVLHKVIQGVIQIDDAIYTYKDCGTHYDFIGSYIPLYLEEQIWQSTK
jgi:hypothetical protein